MLKFMDCHHQFTKPPLSKKGSPAAAIPHLIVKQRESTSRLELQFTAKAFFKSSMIGTGLRLWFSKRESQCTHNFPVSVFSLYKDTVSWISSVYQLVYHYFQWYIGNYRFKYCPLSQVYFPVLRTSNIGPREYTVKYSPQGVNCVIFPSQEWEY